MEQSTVFNILARRPGVAQTARRAPDSRRLAPGESGCMIACGVLTIGDLTGHTKRRLALVATLAAVLLMLSGAATASAPPSPPAPLNDNYISSLELNRHGTKLNASATLKDVRDTTSATVQSNILSPPYHISGPAEATACGAVNYGKTVWYDFYPNANGIARIRASGFDNVITLYRFNVHTALPDVAHKQCVHQSTFPSEELDSPVKKGAAYTFQIGGVNNAGGMLQMLFDYFVTPPRRLHASATLQARALSNGIQLLSLTVLTSRAAHVSVSCGRFCHSKSRFGEALERFPDLKNVQLPAGAKLQIRVTAPHSIGAFIQYSVLAGNFTKITRCTEPGSRKPRRTCH
jgi:hypothetical protein